MSSRYTMEPHYHKTSRNETKESSREGQEGDHSSNWLNFLQNQCHCYAMDVIREGACPENWEFRSWWPWGEENMELPWALSPYDHCPSTPSHLSHQDLKGLLWLSSLPTSVTEFWDAALVNPSLLVQPPDSHSVLSGSELRSGCSTVWPLLTPLKTNR